MTVYDDSFYDTIRDGAQRSAMLTVPIVTDAIGYVPERVIDIGCGEGHWANAFAAQGSEVIGIDGEYTADKTVLGDRFIPHDISTPLPEHLAGRFDLAVCLEVAEHLYADRAPSFVRDLCGLAPVILFSAAIPGQGGTHHVNERWPQFWVDLFNSEGYDVSGALRWLIWNDIRIENWYQQNLMLAVRRGPHTNAITSLLTGPMSYPYPVVHPVLYGARTGQVYP
jgi:SAM-dependent methyltransferase